MEITTTVPLYRSWLAIPFAFALALASHGQDYPEPGVFPPAGAGWQLLFDGTNFTDWAQNEAEGWTVEGSTLIHRGEDGGRSHLFYMGPNNNWRDFEFICEVRTTDLTNSGFIFHSHWFDSEWDPFGNEAQINNTTPNEDWRTGSLYGSRKVTTSPVNDNEWWTQYVRVDDQHVVIRVNDVTTVDWISGSGTTQRELSSGTFALQGHDARENHHVEFRNIYARRLTQPSEGLWVDAGDHGISLANVPFSLDTTVTLDGTAPAPGTVTSAWDVITQPGGATVAIADLANPNTTATFSQDGNYTLRLTVSHAKEIYADSILVRVGNSAPVISADHFYQAVSQETSLTIPGLTVTDDGLPNNLPLTYQWTKLEANGNYTLSDSNVISPTFQFTDPGIYLFNLNVSDSLATTTARFAFEVLAPGHEVEGCQVNQDVVSVYRFDQTHASLAESAISLVPFGNPTFDTSNLSWMTNPRGAAMRFQASTDGLSATIPDALIKQGIPGEYSIEARFFINRFFPASEHKHHILSFFQAWNSFLEMKQSAWHPGPDLKINNQGVLEVATVTSILPRQEWNHLIINVETDGTVTIYVNDELQFVETVPVTTQLQDWELKFGGFDGWIDEVCIRNRAYHPGENQAPIADAGSDQLTAQNTATLSATISDDKIPSNATSATWTTLSEPNAGDVVIDSPTSETTLVTLTSFGTYLFQVAAFDGALTTTDTVRIAYLNPTSDLDNDGWANLVEQYLGTHLGTGDSPIDSGDITGDTMTLIYRRALNGPAGLTGAFEWSTDMTQWLGSGAQGPDGIIRTITETVLSAPGEDPQRIRTTIDNTQGERIFLRLRVTSTP